MTTTPATKENEDKKVGKGFENEPKKVPSLGGFKSHFKALAMLRIALGQRASARSDDSRVSGIESSESSCSESFYLAI